VNISDGHGFRRQSLGTRIVTYADDLVILCRKGKAEEALHRLREIMGKLKLTANEERHESAGSRKGSSTFWDTRSDGCIRREPARRTWVTGHQRRASSTRWRKSMR
jgi:hypothetical protein